VIFIAIVSGTPARFRLRTAVRRKSCGIKPGTPAARAAVFQRFQNVFTACPRRRQNTSGVSTPVASSAAWRAHRPSMAA